METHYEKYKATIKAYQVAHRAQIAKYYRERRAELKTIKEREFVLDYIKKKMN